MKLRLKSNNIVREREIEFTDASFALLISSPACVDSVTLLLVGENSSFHLLDDLLCLPS